MGIGLVSYSAGKYFDYLVPSSFTYWQNQLYNTVWTGVAKGIFTNFTANFSQTFYDTSSFDKSLQNALNPVNLGLSGLSGGLTCYWYFKLKRDGLTAKQQTVKDLTKIRNILELRITPCILPNPAIFIPNVPLPVRTVIPPAFQNNLNLRN